MSQAIPNSKRVILTGASGLLGRAVHEALKKAGKFELLALCHSRPGADLEPIDLLDYEIVNKKFREYQPQYIIHAAAERRPDVAEKNPNGAVALNAQVPAHLASLAKDLNATLIYISTDYVFDGENAPYLTSSKTNPLQLYGKTKRDGEEAVLSSDGTKAIVLRVPVLYGPTSANSESAVNILLDVVQDQSGKQYKMDHYATRYPTNVIDIGNFLVKLIDLKRTVPPIIHLSSPEPYTKYEICLVFAQILSLPHQHIIPDAEPPTGPGATTRPRDCQLYTKETEDLGIGPEYSLFEEWWTERLRST
ncbi:hypothetical protein C8J56DRAFT_915607 [Mycena floridula]|nr:hypothetical protein C8J56DRAFT_915607 [Mycena floridula]